MIKFFFPLAVLFCFTISLFAYNREDLDKLLKTNICQFGSLCNANLSAVKLKGADLRQADLSKANLSDANLMGADLSGAKINGAIFKNTIMPDGEKYTGLGEDYKGTRCVEPITKWGNGKTDPTSHFGGNDDAGKFIADILKDGKEKTSDNSEEDYEEYDSE